MVPDADPRPTELALQTDPTPAAWLDLGESAWRDTVGFGPRGFPAYARLRFVPDPDVPAQRWDPDSLPEDSPHEADVVGALVSRLARFTSSPDDAFFCLWDGFDCDGLRVGSSGGRAEAGPLLEDVAPTVVGCARSYHLFRGPLSLLGCWAPGALQRPWLTPAFVWPADRAWCVANDVDPHWAGIGASERTVRALLDLSDIDVVPATWGEEIPYWI